MSRLLFVLAASALVLPATPAHAQLFPYNPYADTQFDSPEAAAKAAKNWPPFYKEKIDARHQLYYAMGWCRNRKYTFKPENLVDVTKLPESNFSGKVLVTGPGVIGGQTSTGEQMCVMVHPNVAVTKVTVQGTALPLGIKPGMFVRFAGELDTQGQCVGEIDKLEIFTPEGDFAASEFVPGKATTFAAPVSGLREGRLTVLTKQGKLRRATFRLAEKPEIRVNVADYSLAGDGDEATVKGRIYQNDEPPYMKQLFASEVEIKLAHPLGEKR